MGNERRVTDRYSSYYFIRTWCNVEKTLTSRCYKGAITQAAADQKFAAWTSQKDAAKVSSANALLGKKDADKKARLAAEVKIKEAKAEQVRAKKIVAENPVAAADLAAADATEAAAEEPAAE